MPGTNKNTPAQWVGGQRRKLVRRNRSNAGPPRSSTMPVLNPGSAAASLVSSISSIGSDYGKERQSEDRFDQVSVDSQTTQKDLEGTMQSLTRSGEVKTSVTCKPLADGPPTPLPELTAADNSKKKLGLFHSRKPKPIASDLGQHLLTSPLPESTPTKAARFFGLDAKCTSSGSSARDAKVHGHGYNHDPQGGAAVRPALKTQHSIPLLTRLKPDTSKQTRLAGQDLASEQPNSTEASSAAATDGLEIVIPEFANPRPSPIEQATTAPRPMPGPKRRMRKKTPKELQRMSPITEASFESLRPAYGVGEEVSELSVISEYQETHSHRIEQEHGLQLYPAIMPPHSQGVTMLPQYGAFELDEADLSPSEEFYDEGASDDEEDIHVVHPGTRVNLTRARPQLGPGFYIQSPLQHVENTYLDAAEEELRSKAWETTLTRAEAEKQAMDVEIAVLRREHERLNHDFIAATSYADQSVEATTDEDSDDLVSICSSIDLDEDLTVHEAKRLTATRITPGMVTIIDITPRKNKPIPSVGNNSRVHNESELQKKTTVPTAFPENVTPPLITHYHHEDPDCATKSKKSKMTQDESRLLVQNWITDYNNTEQRPISMRVAPDVLADQETPPAPFPKDNEGLPTPLMKPRSDSLKVPKALPKHQCINNGHIFHPVDLKTLPDNAFVNSLEVRPYLQTYTGVKQHVKIPVLCEKCAEDCDENVWECEIAVCRMVVCQTCAEDMEAEWQERAVNGWKYK